MAKKVMVFEGEDTLDAGKELEKGKNIYPTDVKAKRCQANNTLLIKRCVGKLDIF